MKASVVIPVYNTGDLLCRMIDSVLAQTMSDFELICVDDGSTDGSDKVIEEYAERDSRVKLVRQENRGPYEARSTGIAAAVGEYVYICDHDERLHPRLLEFCIYQIEKNGLDIFVFGYENRKEQGDFEIPRLPDFDSVKVRVFDDNVLKTDSVGYLSALSNVHIDQWAHVAKRQLAQAVLCRADYNLPRTLNLIKKSRRWGWTSLELYFYNIGNPDSLIKKPPTARAIADWNRELVGLIELFQVERTGGDVSGVWDVVCRAYLIPNIKMMYNSIRRGRKSLSGRDLDERLRLFSILLYDVFVLRAIPMQGVKFRHRMIYRWLMFRYRPDISLSFEALSVRIAANKDRFEALTDELDRLERDSDILEGVARALRFQNSHATYYYSSDRIERCLRKIALRHSVELSNEFEKGSVLHVMTQCFSVGGHTRVVERWIERSPETWKNSVAVLLPKISTIPDRLADVVEKHRGEIVLFEDCDPVAMALRLRKIASAFERVVLHVNNDDVVPVIAFGTEEFKRPVFLFNHADHVFGLGVSIADGFLDLRSGGRNLSIRHRGVRNSHIVHIPGALKVTSGNVRSDSEKRAARDALGLPPDRKLIVSAASTYKYRPFLGWNFADFMEKVLDEEESCDFVVMGPDRVKGRIRNRNRIHTIGMVPPSVCMQYFKAADLVVDSFPFMSFTSLQDAVTMGAPVLSLKTVMPHLDWMESSKSYVEDVDELCLRARRILADRSYATSVYADTAGRMIDEQDAEKWMEDLCAAYRSVDRHEVRDFKSVPVLKPTEMDLFVEAKNLRIKTKGRLWRFAVVSHVANEKKCHEVVFLPAGKIKAELA